MKKITIPISIVLISITLLLTGCSLKKSNQTGGFVESTPNKSIDLEPKDIDTSEPGQPTNVPATPTGAGYMKYVDFLGINEDVKEFIKEDIDLDGKPEIVIAFEADFGLKVFVLREEADELQKVGVLEGGGYGTLSVRIVKLDNKKQKYILEKLTNGAALSGFALYEIDGDGLELIEYSASPTGVGDDHLVDTNEDGYYDGYVQNRYSYEVLNFDVSRYYKWDGQAFVFDSTGIQLYDYPDNPRDVVSQFLKLNILNNYEEKCDGISKRLSELNISNKKMKFEKEDDWCSALQVDDIGYDVNEKGSTADVGVTLESESTTFSLVKNSDKWQIIDICGANVHGSANKNSTVRATNETYTDGWFFGFIGNKRIHAKFDISGNKVSGVYYYDEYKTNIKLEGYVNDFAEMKDFRTVYLSEDTDENESIMGMFRTDDYIQGCWKNDDVIYPMYLIREGTNITPPRKPDADIMKFDGHWTGKESGYFVGSEADIKVLFDDLIYYELNAFSGANMGVLDSFGILEDNVIKTVFKDKTYDEKKENVVFEFKAENDSLHLDSNEYSFYCGMGVMFDSCFVKGEIDIEMPTALEVGIVDTKEQDALFKKLVGDKYDDFIMYTSYVFYSETTWNGEEVKAGESYLRGCSGCCSYIVSKDHIYAAIIGDEGIYYYTNDKNYANKIPEPMAEWANKKGKIFYNYKEL